AIANNAFTHGESYDQLRKQHGSKHDPTPWGTSRSDDGERRPNKAERRDHAKISSRTRRTHGSSPTQLVVEKLLEGVIGKKCLYHRSGDDSAVACFRDPFTQLVIVGEIVNERLEAA